MPPSAVSRSRRIRALPGFCTPKDILQPRELLQEALHDLPGAVPANCRSSFRREGAAPAEKTEPTVRSAAVMTA